MPAKWRSTLQATSNNYEGRLSYITPKKAATYRLENTHEHLKALHQIALRVENFLALSDDHDFFKSITVPDLELFSNWSGPAVRAAGLRTLENLKFPINPGLARCEPDRSTWERTK